MSACFRVLVAIGLGATSFFFGDVALAEADSTIPLESAPEPPNKSADKPIVVWPTLSPAGDDGAGIALHRPVATEGPVYARAQELDATLRDAVQDLGFTLDVADPGPAIDRARDLDMIERASRSSAHGGGPKDTGTWVLSARLEPLSGDSFLLRVVAVPPHNKQLRVRVERVSGADVSVRGLVILRDLLSTTPAPDESGPRPQESASTGILSPLHSQGRAVLAANAALFGAFTAYSVQRASGSDDPRLLYPLLTLGTGLGLGSALLVAEEWDVGTGDAWTLAGGAWWGAASGVLIANGRNIVPLTDRYAWGVGGGLIGLSFATFVLSRGSADEGDAVLVHSGAALGMSFGALADLFYVGDIENRTPHTGAGYGAAAGLVAAGLLATQVQVSSQRVLLVDLGAGLGAASGAALASPLVFQNVTESKARGFVSATAAGMIVGGGVAWVLTRGSSNAASVANTISASGMHVVPMGGVIGSSETRYGTSPAYGVGIRGIF
ncbi:MAG: hypothetical protein FWD73_12725 [Polyangiaceae bacterium]|nr:hypothetical protein [Polyangiaceae bacterium]